MMSQVKTIEGRQLQWSPQLDLRNCGVDMMTLAIKRLQEKAYEPWFGAYLAEHGVGEAELGMTCAAFARAVAGYLAAPTGNIHAAFEAAGVLDEPPARLAALYMTMGQISLGHFAYAMGHSNAQPLPGVTFTAESVDPTLPYAAALARLLDEGTRIAAQLYAPPESSGDMLAAALLVLRRRGRVTVAAEHDNVYLHTAGVKHVDKFDPADVTRLEGLGGEWDDTLDCWAFPQ